MDSYLFEQEKLLKHKRNGLVFSIIFALFMSVLTSAAAFILVWLFSPTADFQDIDQWTTAEITFDRIEEMRSRRGGGSSYYIYDREGNEYYSISSRSKNEKLMEQLVPGQTYTIKYAEFNRLFSSSPANQICLIKDSSQIYLSYKEGVAEIRSDVEFYTGLVLWYVCFVVCAFAAMFLWRSDTIKRNFKRWKLSKKRIRYFKNKGEPLPEEPSLDLALEKIIQAAEKRGEEVQVNNETAEVFLPICIQKAQDDLHRVQLLKHAFRLLFAGSLILFFCVFYFFTANCQVENDWSTHEIVFDKIGAEEYLASLQNLYLYDQEGNKYRLPYSVEYQYFDLKEQLINGQTYEIVYGSNKYLYQDCRYVYQLRDGSTTYIDEEKAKEVFTRYKKILKRLAICCLPVIVLIFIAVSRNKSLKNKQKEEESLLAFNEGLLCFYERTGLLIQELHSKEEGQDQKTEKETLDPMIINHLAKMQTQKGRKKNKSMESTETVLLHKQFAAKKWSFYFLAICLGVISWLCLAEVFQQENNLSFSSNAAMLVFSLELLLIIGWLFIIGRQRQIEFSQQSIVVYHESSYWHLGWLLFATLLFWWSLMYTDIGSPTTDGDSINSWIIWLTLMMLFALLIVVFSGYRNYRLILEGETIEVVTTLGWRRYYQKSDIAVLKLSWGNIVVLDANNKKLFKIDTELGNVSKFYYALIGQQNAGSENAADGSEKAAEPGKDQAAKSDNKAEQHNNMRA